MLQSLGGAKEVLALGHPKEFRNRNIIFQSQLEKEEQHNLITDGSEVDDEWSASMSSATFASRYKRKSCLLKYMKPLVSLYLG